MVRNYDEEEKLLEEDDSDVDNKAAEDGDANLQSVDMDMSD